MPEICQIARSDDRADPERTCGWPSESSRGGRAASHSRRAQRLALEPKDTTLLPRRRCVTRRAALLAAYRETASIRAAADAAGITPILHYEWIERDAAYRRDFGALQEEVADGLQDQAVERAAHGWTQPVFYRGRQCGAIQHYSDRLIILLLKARMPDKYR